MLDQATKGPFPWVWLIPAGLITMAQLALVESFVALAIGLAAALSLSGSI